MYEGVIEYLTSCIGATAQGVGLEDARVDKLTEARLCDLFERYVVGEEGDERQYFLVDDGDIPYVYDGRCYRRTDDILLKWIVKRVMSDLQIGVVYQKNSARKIVEECFDGLRSSPRTRFEADRRFVVFSNLVLDVRSGLTYPFSIDYRTDVVLDFAYDEGARSPLWERVLEETIPDAGMRCAYQQFCGALLADRAEFKIEYICLMIGTGRNGKSVICKAVSDVFGDSLVSSYSPEQLFKSQQSMYNLADIQGKLCNYADDVSDKDFSGGDFKQFVSGAKFQARHIYGRPFTVTRVPLMMCCVNKMPPNTDDTNGYYRRLLPIVCPNQISDERVDLELPMKLSVREVKSAIFNWLYEGYRSLVSCGGRITLSENIVRYRDEIRNDGNSCRRWVREYNLHRVEPTSRFDERWKSFREWMNKYLQYCRDYSEIAKTAKSVTVIFKECGFECERRSDGMWWCIGEGADARVSLPEIGRESERSVDDLPF